MYHFDISFCLTTFNRHERLINRINQLINSNPNFSYEIIVIDASINQLSLENLFFKDKIKYYHFKKCSLDEGYDLSIKKVLVKTFCLLQMMIFLKIIGLIL